MSTEPRRDQEPFESFDPSPLFVLLDGIRRAAPRAHHVPVTRVIPALQLTLRAQIHMDMASQDAPTGIWSAWTTAHASST